MISILPKNSNYSMELKLLNYLLFFYPTSKTPKYPPFLNNIMIKELHKSTDRGIGDLAWLKSRFSFSFARYYNPDRRGYGKIRVLNDDIIEPDRGFGMHPHEDMEIITIVTKGVLEHKDNTGNSGLLRSGEVQVMSAGSGIMHSEINHSKTDRLELFQIWIETKEKGIDPGYDQREVVIRDNKLELVVSGDKNDDRLYIHQDAKISLGRFEKGESFEYEVGNGKNGVFIFVIEGFSITI